MDFNKYFDHTILKPDTNNLQIKQLCKEAIQYNFASVCIAPTWILNCKNNLLDTENDIKIASVIGFPHGNSILLDKIDSLHYSKSDDATEFDVVINIGMIKSGYWKAVEQEIKYVKEAANDLIVKYIVEVGYLTDEELFRVMDLLIKYKVDFIKTCTGYGPRNVELNDIIKIKRYVKNEIKIKASGGIKTYEFAKQLIEAGSDRLGTSASVSIMDEYFKATLL